jgi:hypothetical protein
MSSTGSPARLSELIAALSLATDLGLGEPMEHVLRSCLISMRLGERMGLTYAELAEVYYVSLLAWVGCMSDSTEMSALFGDDIAWRADAARVDDGPLAMPWSSSECGIGRPTTETGAPERPSSAHRRADHDPVHGRKLPVDRSACQAARAW